MPQAWDTQECGRLCVHLNSDQNPIYSLTERVKNYHGVYAY